MKTGTTDHPKTKALARLLGVGRYAAIGLLEALWHATAKYSPRGDIGRFSDAEIADLCFWDGPAPKLVKALVDSGWLDTRAKGRLVVHDWHEHAEDAVNMRLARAGERFANGSNPKLGRLPPEEKAIARAKYKGGKSPRRAHGKRTTNAPPSHALALPSHALPSHAVVEPRSANNDPPSVPIPLSRTETRIRRWIGDRLSANDRNAIARAERLAGESPPVEIHGKSVPFADLFARAVEEAIASDAKFHGGSKFMGLVDTIAARCTRDGVWPGEGLERTNGHAREPTTDELLAKDRARRAKP